MQDVCPFLDIDTLSVCNGCNCQQLTESQFVLDINRNDVPFSDGQLHNPYAPTTMPTYEPKPEQHECPRDGTWYARRYRDICHGQSVV